jgi:prenyltransferase beta subunit
MFLLFLVSGSFVSARTREKSLENFIIDTRVSVEGFADTPTGELSLSTTTLAMEISSKIHYDVNNTLGILLFYQKSQNSDGGFAENPNGISNWESTIKAVRGLKTLDLNSSSLHDWTIFKYLNETATELLYTNIVEGNSSRSEMKPLSIDTIRIWREYIQTSLLLGFPPIIDTIDIITQLRDLQLPNGTYTNFELAVETISFLKILSEFPDDIVLAAKYLLAHTQNNGAFSDEAIGKTSLVATYEALFALEILGKLEDLPYEEAITRFILNLQKPNSGFSEYGEEKVTITDSWYAVHSLQILQQLDQLLSPDVLQTNGFISLQSYSITLSLILITIRRRKNG